MAADWCLLGGSWRRAGVYWKFLAVGWCLLGVPGGGLIFTGGFLRAGTVGNTSHSLSPLPLTQSL